MHPAPQDRPDGEAEAREAARVSRLEQIRAHVQGEEVQWKADRLVSQGDDASDADSVPGTQGVYDSDEEAGNAVQTPAKPAMVRSVEIYK